MHSSCIWGTNCPAGGVIITVLSRVVEKSAAFTLNVLERVLDELGAMGILKNVQHLVFWSDTGPHYRANRVLTAHATRILEKFKELSGRVFPQAPNEIHVRFTLEHHGKDWCDLFFCRTG